MASNRKRDLVQESQCLDLEAMDRKHSTIFLGDLVRAIRKLKVSDFETQRLIAEMLGLTLAAPIVDLPPVPARMIQPTEIPPEIPPTSLESTPEAASGDSIPIKLEHFKSKNDEWIREVEPLASPASEESYAQPELEPLLLPQWTRAILAASLATRTEDGLPDLEKITEILARGEAIRELPTRSSPTLRRGVQLLIDKSRAMMPFLRDQAWLQKEIRKVVGGDRVQVRRFVGSPLRGPVPGPPPWPDYAPPLPGTPVVLLTDLGICQPMLGDDWADIQEWTRFSVQVQQANCPLIAFVPYDSSRWPNELRRRMTIVQWDRNTTAPTIRSIIRDGLEVART